ncbi:MAG: protein-glutamine gamma-glutamyltransferase, partial [Acetanaerobacterium sp.]
ALLALFGAEKFNVQFSGIYLMNWHRLHRHLREVGQMRREDDYLPGDRRYFSNPDVDPLHPEWQGENVIDLNDGMYYGHGMGRRKADEIIRALNRKRKEDATRSAYLMDSAGRPNFKGLSALYHER